MGWSHEEKPDGCVKKYFKNLTVCAIIAKAICAKLGGVKMKHIKTLNTQTLNNTEQTFDLVLYFFSPE